ncbi:MAG: exodeoxyribonuclease V subunit gamma, partial [Chloroflexi bacterium]|nr:exodeoxyribonuclease V subunit gamma [Chloroflexota bacterium]
CALADSIHVVGFHQFSASQLDLMDALAGVGISVVIHLVHDAMRPLLFESSSRTLRRLMSRYGAIAGPGSAAMGDAILPDLDDQAPSLARLEREIFRPGGTTALADETITVLEAPGEYVECEMIAQQIHRLRNEFGIPFGDCAIVVRSVGEYAPRLRSVMQRYQVPLSASTLEPLAENPAVQFLMRLFSLLCSDWPREDLLRVLRSSFVGLELRSADVLEQAARRDGILAGVDRWLALAARLKRRGLITFLERLAAWRSVLAEARPEEVIQQLRRCAIACFLGRAHREGLTTDDAAEKPGESFLQGAGSRRRLSELLVSADRAALRTAARVAAELHRMKAAQAETSGLQRQPGAAVLVDELLDLWRTTTYSVPPQPIDSVQLLDAYAISPAEFPVVFTTGLLEGLFPRRAAEDPFLRDEERKALSDPLPDDMPLSDPLLSERPLLLHTSLEKADEEPLLFHRAISAVGERLFLTYPRVTGEGKDCLPSFYFDAIRAVVGGLERRTSSRTLADVAPLPEQAFNERDKACAVAVAAGDWRRGPDTEFLSRCKLYFELLSNDAAMLARVCDGVDRQPPFVLQCGWSVADTGRSFSVSDIETFSTCPYKFFASRRLRINVERTAPDRLDKGNIMHQVVQRFLREIGDGELPEQDTAIARLEAILDEELLEFKRDARPYQLRLFRQSLALLLPSFFDREKEYREYSKLRPRYQEISFGDSGAARQQGTSVDPGSSSTPLTVDGPAGGPVKIHGRMDRVDFSPDGVAAVMDYKLGHAKSLADMEAGRSLQVPIYFMALEQVFNLRVGAAFYDCFDRNERTAVVRHDAIDQILLDRSRANGGLLVGGRYGALMQIARDSVVSAADRIAAGEIPPVKDEHCRMCDFGDVCRS